MHIIGAVPTKRKEGMTKDEYDEAIKEHLENGWAIDWDLFNWLLEKETD